MDDQPVASTSGLQNPNLAKSKEHDESLNDLAIARILQNEYDSQTTSAKAAQYGLEDEGDDSEGTVEEYEVEAIRAKRKNTKTGVLEYYVKWANYPESQNTWEPIDNLKCPELVTQFDAAEKSKRKRRNTTDQQNLTQSQASQSQKRPRTKITPVDGNRRDTNNHRKDDDDNDDDADVLVVEKGNNGTERAGSSRPSSRSGSVNSRQDKQSLESSHQTIKGFARKKPIDRIIGSCFDSDDKIFFFVKFKDVSDIDLIEVRELEEKAPRELCCWYRERMYYSLHNPDQLHQVPNQTSGDRNGSTTPASQLNNKSSTTKPTPVA